MIVRYDHDSWELWKHLDGKEVVGCRWVFAIKYHLDIMIERLKARLVAKRFTHIYEVDYFEIFSNCLA